MPERCDSCAWLDDMVQACGFLAKIAAGNTRESFAGDAVAEAKYHIARHLGEGARHQSADVRERFPTVNWKKLDLWATIDSLDAWERALLRGNHTAEELEAMIFRVTPDELWTFIVEEAPAIEAALR